MNRARGLVLGGCGLLLALAGVIVTAPGVLGPLGSMAARTLDASLERSELVLVAIGLATALVGSAIASSGDLSAARRPDLEAIITGVDSTATGSRFDERLERLSDAAGDDRAAIEGEIREEVTATAVTVLARTRGLTRSDASDRLGDGSWTADPQAAAFFTRRPPPVLVRLREWLSTAPVVDQRLGRVLAELEAEMGLEAGPDPSGAESRVGERRWAPDELAEGVSHRVDSGASDPPADDRVIETVRVSGEQAADPADGPAVVTARRFGLVVGLMAVAAGLVTGVTTPFLLGFLAVSYSLTKYVTRPPVPAVEVTRVLASDSPVPGDLVEVELRVRNVGDRPFPDVRVIDGVPAALRIVGGSPALATSLPAGGTASLRYQVRAKRGTFTFDETQLVTRDLGNVRERAVSVAVPTRLTGATPLEDVALAAQASRRIGTVKTDTGGSGVEFYGTREYRPGDPMSSVNWNQLAKTGELTTVEFREQRAPTVSIVLDQRDASRVAPTATALDGVDLCVYAAERAFLTLLDAGTEVGLITYGDRLTDVEPASDAAQRALVQSRLRAATDRYAAALGEATVDSTGAVHHRRSPAPELLDHHVPRNAQVLVLSPATDDFALAATERLAALGHPVTLLSPAVAAAGSLGGRHRRLDRACRLQTIREQGTRVIDWQPDEPIQLAIARATEQVGGG